MSLIYLTGMTGVGKTTAGELLARRLGMDFIDLDTEIERSEDLTIAELFEERGEERFRNLESRVLAMFGETTRGVIALGAGALERDENAQLVHRTGKLIYLATDIQVLADRLKTATNRPMLASAESAEGLFARLQTLYARRRIGYEKSDLTVTVSPKDSAADVVDHIIEVLVRK